MRKHLGLLSFLILVLTGFTWYSFYTTGSFLNTYIPKKIWSNGGMYYGLLVVGFSASSLFCLFSPKGFWKKASATLLIGIPVGFISIVVLFAVSHM